MLSIFVAKLTHQWAMVDRLAGNLAKKFLSSRVPTFSFIAFLGVDEAAHLSTPFSRKTLAAYEKIDEAMGQIIPRTKAKRRL